MGRCILLPSQSAKRVARGNRKSVPGPLIGHRRPAHRDRARSFARGSVRPNIPTHPNGDKEHTRDGLSIDLCYELEVPGLGKLKIDAEPEEIEAAKSLIRTTVEAAQGFKSTPPSLSSASAVKTLEDAIGEYFAKAQMKPQTKATYRGNLEHARKFFGGTSNLFDLGQGDLVRYCDHVGGTIAHPTTQGLYISTVASFLNWHRTRVTGFPELTTKTLMHRKDTPDSDDRDAFTADQLRQVIHKRQQYREKVLTNFGYPSRRYSSAVESRKSVRSI
jgi:predicted Rdx family selenoprotein